MLEDDRIGDGFPGQRITILPRPRVKLALSSPGTSSLVVTDVGFYPHALHHGRDRTVPVSQAIVIICAKGRGWFESGSGRVSVSAGQFLVIPPRILHSYGADDADPWTLWWFHVDGSLVDEWCTIANLGPHPVARDLADPTEAIGLVQQMLTRMQFDTTTSSILAAAGVAWHLMTLLLVRQIRVTSTHDVIESTALYLQEHYSEHIPVPELASRAQLSISHFSARFRQQIGQSVRTYVTDLRMSRARELLDTTTMAVASIAEAVGYEDSFYFTRQFKRIHGQTPTAYRRLRKG